ncbi:hypothetical protein ACJJTC_002027 [Scirpophaga incertulas]
MMNPVTGSLLTDLPQTPIGFDDIDFNNYIPNHRSYNTVVYYHKKLYTNVNKNETEAKRESGKPAKLKSKTKRKLKEDKTQQFNSEKLNKSTQLIDLNADKINIALDKSVKSLQNVVPLPIPTNAKPLNEPLYFTIKTTNKHRRHVKKSREQNNDEIFISHKKGKPQKIETMKTRVSRNQGCYVGELFDPSSQNTLDDLHLNINQSSSYSEISESKCRKRERTDEKRIHNTKKYLISNSFDALMTESCNAECSKIKIQLMNETAKKLLSDSIKVPICTAIEDFLSQIPHQYNNNVELENVQKALVCNSQKLDDILQRLTCIEKKLCEHAEIEPCNIKQDIAEELSNNKEVIIDDNLSEEYDMCERRARERNIVKPIEENFVRNIHKIDTKNCTGDATVSIMSSQSINQLGIKPNRPNKLPARFCWTDSDNLKLMQFCKLCIFVI